MSPQTQRPQLTATSSFDNNIPRNNEQDLEFNKSTKKIDKIVEKINTFNAVKEQPEQKDNTNSPGPHVIYLDSSNSPNGANYTQPSQSDQAPNGDKAVAEQQPRTSNKGEEKQDGMPKHLQVETQKSPDSSLIYNTPPYSPQPDTISDLDEDDIRALNEIQQIGFLPKGGSEIPAPLGPLKTYSL